MIQLAFIEIVDLDTGKERKIPAADVSDVLQEKQGARIVMRDGRVIQSSTTADAIFTAIDTLWGEYITALGDPS